MYNCFRFFAHSPDWNVIHQAGFLGWLLTPVKQYPAVVQEFPIYISKSALGRLKYILTCLSAQ